jgi:hypothetical protein
MHNWEWKFYKRKRRWHVSFGQYKICGSTTNATTTTTTTTPNPKPYSIKLEGGEERGCWECVCVMWLSLSLHEMIDFVSNVDSSITCTPISLIMRNSVLHLCCIIPLTRTITTNPFHSKRKLLVEWMKQLINGGQQNKTWVR